MVSSRTDHRRRATRGVALRTTRPETLGLAALGELAAGAKPATAGNSKLVYAAHISLAPTWFDPAETPGIVTPLKGQG